MLLYRGIQAKCQYAISTLKGHFRLQAELRRTSVGCLCFDVTGLMEKCGFPGFLSQAARQHSMWGGCVYKAWRCPASQTRSYLAKNPPALPRLFAHSPHPNPPADTVACPLNINSLTLLSPNTNPKPHTRVAVEHATGSSRANGRSTSTSCQSKRVQALAIPYISVAPGSRHSLPCGYTCLLPRDVVGCRIPCLPCTSPAFQSPTRCPSQSM